MPNKLIKQAKLAIGEQHLELGSWERLSLHYDGKVSGATLWKFANDPKYVPGPEILATLGIPVRPYRDLHSLQDWEILWLLNNREVIHEPG